VATLRIEPRLIARAQRGDAAAFDQVVSAAFQTVYNTAYRIVGNADDACDATQETFVRAFRAIRSFRSEASFSTWLYRITINVCLDLLPARPPPDCGRLRARLG
jgi:RNA polymerase sigma-70 factor (ECF subfamily)